MKKLAFQILGLLPDGIYLRFRYLQRVGAWPNLKQPRRFSEKVQWLKLHDRNPEMTKWADKIEFKSLVSEKIGSDYVIPLLAEGRRAEECTEATIPDCSFVLKTNHDSGGVLIFEDAKKASVNDIQSWIRKRLSNSLFWQNREWEYKNIPPGWLIEPLLKENSGASRLNDFKVHCFNGVPKLIQTITDRGSEVKENWFDTDWNSIDICYFSNVRAQVDRPPCLEEILSISSELGALFPYIRLDFYVYQGQPLLGEATFRPFGGFMRWDPDQADYLLGEMLDLGQLSDADSTA